MKKVLVLLLLALALLSLVDAFKKGDKGRSKVQEEEKTKPVSRTRDVEIKTLKKPKTCTRKAQPGNTVAVHYEGTFAEDGRMFDSSRARGDPFWFQLGRMQVIQGWEKGMLGMCIGETRELIVPSNWGYGDQGHPPVIPPGATLKFVIELLDISDAPPPPRDPPPPQREFDAEAILKQMEAAQDTKEEL
eukprot:TRINITY_DN5019_c0_g1_i2.p1 TRINITY_DN5019_c0_g1~~TRINITY_DN5019_c0_g1_i2.p1  ORF type:complete len:200 (-),score=60.37 TRINITY_DN5019_c0_g1_i2:452-1018(-)